MIRLICSKCNKAHYLKNINDFSACDCGSTLTPAVCELINNAALSIIEANAKLENHSDSGLCGKFNIDFI